MNSQVLFTGAQEFSSRSLIHVDSTSTWVTWVHDVHVTWHNSTWSSIQTSKSFEAVQCINPHPSLPLFSHCSCCWLTITHSWFMVSWSTHWPSLFQDQPSRAWVATPVDMEPPFQHQWNCSTWAARGFFQHKLLSCNVSVPIVVSYSYSQL